MDFGLEGLLGRLVSLIPGDGRITALARRTCAEVLSVAPLPAPVRVGAARTEAEAAVVDFAEQFSIDVSEVDDELRASLVAALGPRLFTTVVGVFIADFLPRVRAGLSALGIAASWADRPIAWDDSEEHADLLFNQVLPGVARLRALDPVTSEIVRLRGATQHNCRLCKSLREGNALDAGGSETLYAQIDRYESADALTAGHRAALRYVDAVIWSPGRISSEVADGVLEHFSAVQAVELTLDVMRNASNKIAVALGADAPRVDAGLERYLIDADGQTVFA